MVLARVTNVRGGNIVTHVQTSETKYITSVCITYHSNLLYHLLHLDLDSLQDLDLGQMSELEIDTKDESGVTLFPRQCNGQSEGGLGCPVSSVRVSIMLTPS